MSQDGRLAEVECGLDTEAPLSAVLLSPSRLVSVQTEKSNIRASRTLKCIRTYQATVCEGDGWNRKTLPQAGGLENAS